MQRLPSPLNDTIASTEDELRVPPRNAKRPLEEDEDEPSTSPRNKSPRLTMDKALENLSSFQIENARRILATELDTALSVKHDAEKALLDLLHRDGSVAVTQAERVQARHRKQEAEDTFHRVYERLHRPSQTLATMGNLKKSFDAHAICACEFERAQKEAQIAKNRLDQTQAHHDAALQSDWTDDCDLEVVWDMFMRSDRYGAESE
jgi:G3E family GTPase